jgi:SAM-dependent methyltransferase
MATTAQPDVPPADPARVEAFTGRALGDLAGTMATILCAIGDRLGLLADLADHGPGTSIDLAGRAGVHERYAREWLRGMHAAGYLTHDAATGRFALPAEHAPVLAEEAGPIFFGGAYQELLGVLPVVHRVIEAFTNGGGVPQEAYAPDTWAGMERFTAGWFENLLVEEWLPALPAERERLDRGALVADVGCGAGRALLRLAREFPRSRFVGYDAFPAQVERARANAAAAGPGERVSFEVLDVGDGLDERYNLVTTFDVVHDAVDPLALVRAIREALRPGGTYVMLEINCSDRPEENAGPIGTVLYGFSLLYCMTTSLAHGGAGLGTCGLPPARVEELGHEAGFSSVERLPVENPFNILYALRP